MERNGQEYDIQNPHLQEVEGGDSTNEIQTASAPSVAQQLEAERSKADEYLDMLRRSQADFVNYKRRAGQEQAETRVTTQNAVIEQLFPVLDDLGRALGAAPQELLHHPWVQGILLIEKRLTATLEQLGVRQIGKVGERFDPRWHEALMTEMRADVPEGTITYVSRPGYAQGERVLRPAQVVVAGSPS